jgi:hypothetical protein
MARSVADLEAELEAARHQLEEEARLREVAARGTAARQRAALIRITPELEALERELEDALDPVFDDRGHLLFLRGSAREFLLGGRHDPEVPSRSLELELLCERDPFAGRLHTLHQQLVVVVVSLTGEAGLDYDHDLVVRADDAECKAWRGLMARIRYLADGEEGY